MSRLVAPFVTIPLPTHPPIRYPSPAMPNPIVHFEIPADDVQRAIKFLRKSPRLEDLSPVPETLVSACLCAFDWSAGLFAR